jgi:hypothetical protein
MRAHCCCSAILLALCSAAVPAVAEPYDVDPYPMDPGEEPSRGFIEVFGNWGVNLGRTQYVPDETPGESRHPFAKGFGGGGALGVALLPDQLSLFADYRYGQARTREGSTLGVLSEVQGSIDFHQITIGLRIHQRAGAGSLYGQMGFGVMLPFETELELRYAPELRAAGIRGEGVTEDEYGWGYGGHAELGYKIQLRPTRAYLGIGARIAAFQATNHGRETELTNVVTDFTATPPVPVTTTIHYSKDGPNAPTTYSVQDIRLNISVGYEF